MELPPDTSGQDASSSRSRQHPQPAEQLQFPKLEAASAGAGVISVVAKVRETDLKEA
jgi:hypothetical protein